MFNIYLLSSVIRLDWITSTESNPWPHPIKWPHMIQEHAHTWPNRIAPMIHRETPPHDSRWPHVIRCRPVAPVYDLSPSDHVRRCHVLSDAPQSITPANHPGHTLEEHRRSDMLHIVPPTCVRTCVRAGGHTHTDTGGRICACGRVRGFVPQSTRPNPIASNRWRAI